MAKSLWCCLTVLLVNLILGATDGLEAKKSARTCVIGAGYSGLGTARYLKEYGVNFTVFEATRHVGGTWRFDPHVGTDEDGVTVFTSMYKNLRTNTPIQTMEYTGFPFPEDMPSYPSATCFHRYLKLFTKTYGFEDNIQFQSLVTSVKWAKNNWDLTYLKTDTRTEVTEACDYVFIANGEYLKPLMPKIPGMSSFKGSLIHSHDYKDPETYRNRRVLVIGAGASGLDLATHLSNVTSRLVHSHHLAYNQPYFGPNYVKKPDILEFTPNGVVFEDGSYEEIDDVICCTGYDYDHPFLDSSSGVTKNGKFILPLYQHMVNIRHPTMLFIGAPKKVINKVLGAQGQYAAALAAGKFQLPPQEVMLRSWLSHVQSLKARKMKILDVNVIGDQMDRYFANLTAEAGVVRVPPVISEIRDFNAKYRLENLLNYRDYDFRIVDDGHYKWWYNKREGLPCPIGD